MDRDAIEALVDTLGADAMRISTEIEKLRLYAGPGGEDRGRGAGDSGSGFQRLDDLRAGGCPGAARPPAGLGLVDTLVRQGEYMPLALSFLASLFRLALVAKEKGLRSPQQIQQALSKPGRPVWRSKAEQIHQTASGFTKAQLETGLKQIFAADWGLRDARPSDRIVMEKFILGLAG